MAQKGRRQQVRRRKMPPAKGLSRKVWVGAVAVLALAAMGVLILASLVGAPTTPASAPGEASGQGSARGSPEAKVTVVEYSDFQCPFCARFALDTFSRLDQTYVKAGKVRWVFRHFPRIGQESVAAAQAAECAGEQGQFWPYHDKLFASQAGENRGGFSSSRLKSLARELGLDGAAFGSCLDSGRWASKVSQDLAEGQRKGVEGTPTFFVGEKKVVGAQPYGVFEAAIEEALRP